MPMLLDVAAGTAGFAVTSDMIKPITDGITTSVNNMLPACLGVMAVMVGIGLIPRLIYKFL